MIAEPPPEPPALVVRFEGLKPGGQVQVAVFDSERGWKSRKQALVARTLPVAGGMVEARFDKLKPGAYGVMAYHDRNSNGRLDTLPIGLPTEPYGFSKNARGAFGPPAWSAASRELKAGEVAVETIRLR